MYSFFAVNFACEWPVVCAGMPIERPQRTLTTDNDGAAASSARPFSSTLSQDTWFSSKSALCPSNQDPHPFHDSPGPSACQPVPWLPCLLRQTSSPLTLCTTSVWLRSAALALCSPAHVHPGPFPASPFSLGKHQTLHFLAPALVADKVGLSTQVALSPLWPACLARSFLRCSTPCTFLHTCACFPPGPAQACPALPASVDLQAVLHICYWRAGKRMRGKRGVRVRGCKRGRPQAAGARFSSRSAPRRGCRKRCSPQRSEGVRKGTVEGRMHGGGASLWLTSCPARCAGRRWADPCA